MRGTKMNNSKNHKGLSTGILLGSLSLLLTQPGHATLLDPAQSPLILSESVAPNMIFTLDDSGSMRYARVPDAPAASSESRRVKSSHYNPLYYNPAVTYPLPIKYNADGSRASSQYTTSFATAYLNGFNTSKGSIDLSSEYQVTWTYDPTGDGSNFPSNAAADNPSPEYYFNSGNFNLSLTGTATSTAQTINNVTFTVTRSTSGTGCSAAITSPLDMGNASCSRSSNTYQVTTTDQRGDNVAAYYYVFDATQPNCTQTATDQKEDDNCYKRIIVSSTSGQIRTSDTAAGKNELNNFARWYSFYRNRALTTMSAANIAFSGLPSTVRLTWQRLNSCNSFNDGACKNYLRKFSQHQRGNFFNWLSSSPFSGGTPLRVAQQKAGEFIASNDAWAYNPYPLNSTGGTGSTVRTPEYSCRANYHLLMTDGLWNGNNGATSATLKPDHSNTTLPDSTSYTQQHPFTDDTTKTLADLAFHYWATDARNLTNDIKPIIQAPNANTATQYWDPRNDPATWQHLTTFTVGVGLTAALNEVNLPWSGETNTGAGYQALVSGAQDWPAASSDSNSNVYDLWHTAINSRGEFFSADTPEAIVSAFREIISRISNRTTSAGAPGVTASIVEDTLNREVYETKFNSEDWSGDLTKFRITESGVRSAVWNAQTKIDEQSATSRNIKMFSAVAASKLQDFLWDNLTTEQQTLLNRNYDVASIPTDALGNLRLDYIRGDQSREGSATGAFRIRSSVLSDIVNSSPVIVGTPKYVSYLADQIDGGTLANGNSSYGTFKAANRAERLSVETASPRRPMVYVGANDGMLHGFDANTGSEVFAYVPTAVMENLFKLPSQRYTGTSHHFYVDGTPTVADVYYDDAWHTVLIGTLRAGGRSIFALDITDPDNIKLLWEKSSTDTDFGNLGYTYSQPVVARLHTGKWAVVTGNGYGNQAASAADLAALMVIDIKTGNLVRELTITANSTLPNGLSTPRLADNNSDGVADYAYAGDLQGNMWRFDLVTTSASPASPDPFRKDLIGTIQPSVFKIAFAGTPLYTAIDGRATGATAQAITAPPSLVRHPTGLGYIVAFGTGKYFETTDGNIDSTRAMTVYGIWDRATKGQDTLTRTSPTRTNLQEQTITEQATSNPFSANETVQGLRLVSQNSVLWYDANNNVNKHGWYLDFKVSGATSNTGEMLINPMAARGKVLLLNTLTPNANPCREGVDSWLYGLDPTTGGRTNFNVFDLNNDKVIDANDSVQRNGSSTVVSSYKKPGSGGFTTNNGDIYTAPSQGSGMKYSAGPTTKGRQSWRIIPEEAQ